MLEGLAKLRAGVLKQNSAQLYGQLEESGKLAKHCTEAAKHVRDAVPRANQLGLNEALTQSEAGKQFIYGIIESFPPNP